jgi:hypothetical protein
LTEASFGYEPTKFDFTEPTDQGQLGAEDAMGPTGKGMIRNLREVKLYEISPVPLGMNALTQIRAVKAAVIQAAKAAIPPKETPKAAESTAWDAAAVLKDCNDAKALRLVHAWVDPEGDPESKSSYKLPHHLANGDVVWRGVAACGAVMMGGRGGVSIPDSDMAGVRKHLQLHYDQFEKDAPWSKDANIGAYADTLLAIHDQLKEGRILSGASKEKITAAVDALSAALDALNGLLAAAEPPKALRTDVLIRRLRAAELALALR